MINNTMDREVYIGFNTVERDTAPYTLTGVELVKRDLLNTFQTRRGERAMRPNYGTIIHDLLMEPFDEITKEEILTDARRIIDEEPRVELASFDVVELDHILRIDVELIFLPGNQVDNLRIEYDRKNQQDR